MKIVTFAFGVLIICISIVSAIVYFLNNKIYEKYIVVSLGLLPLGFLFTWLGWVGKQNKTTCSSNGECIHGYCKDYKCVCDNNWTGLFCTNFSPDPVKDNRTLTQN